MLRVDEGPAACRRPSHERGDPEDGGAGGNVCAPPLGGAPANRLPTADAPRLTVTPQTITTTAVGCPGAASGLGSSRYLQVSPLPKAPYQSPT